MHFDWNGLYTIFSFFLFSFEVSLRMGFMRAWERKITSSARRDVNMRDELGPRVLVRCPPPWSPPKANISLEVLVRSR